MLDADPDNEQTAQALLRWHLSQGDNASALALLRDVAARSPEDPTGRLNVAPVHAGDRGSRSCAGRVAAARRHRNRERTLPPGSRAARFRARQSGRGDRRAPDADRGRGRHPGTPRSADLSRADAPRDGGPRRGGRSRRPGSGGGPAACRRAQDAGAPPHRGRQSRTGAAGSEFGLGASGERSGDPDAHGGGP